MFLFFYDVPSVSHYCCGPVYFKEYIHVGTNSFPRWSFTEHTVRKHANFTTFSETGTTISTHNAAGWDRWELSHTVRLTPMLPTLSLPRSCKKNNKRMKCERGHLLKPASEGHSQFSRDSAPCLQAGRLFLSLLKLQLCDEAEKVPVFWGLWSVTGCCCLWEYSMIRLGRAQVRQMSFL